jgi:hypothetical protein
MVCTCENLTCCARSFPSCRAADVHVVQAAVTVLLARKASPAMRMWQSADRPPCTPADMAAAGSHAGLAAFLAEAQLNELLVGLKLGSRRQGAHDERATLFEGPQHKQMVIRS